MQPQALAIFREFRRALGSEERHSAEPNLESLLEVRLEQCRVGPPGATCGDAALADPIGGLVAQSFAEAGRHLALRPGISRKPSLPR